MADFDSMVDDTAGSATPQAPSVQQTSMLQTPSHTEPGALPSFDSLEDDSAKYNTPGQTAKAAIEGLGRGIAGPIAPYVEKHIMGVKPSDIRGREAAHPIVEGAGEALGLGAGMLTGSGLGAATEAGGKLAAEAVGLAEPVSYASRVGSAAVKSAVDMALLQSSDEAAKQVINDPASSSESAIANIGLAGVLGGVAGGFMTGAVSPLWEATVGPQVEKFLGGMKGHLNGDGILKIHTPEEVDAALNTLGVGITPEMRAGLSGNPKAATLFNELREIQHPAIVEGLKKLETDVNESIFQAIGRTPEEVANYSEAEGGKAAMDSFKKEYKAKYEPIAKEYDALTEPFQQAPVSSVQKANLADKIASTAQEKGFMGLDMPQDKVVNAVLSRLNGVKSAEDFMKLRTVVGNMTYGEPKLTAVRHMLNEMLDHANFMSISETMGAKSTDLLERLHTVRAEYSKLAKISERVNDELSLGRFKGPKTLLKTIAEKRSAEQFINKLTPKGNADIIEFLGTHFPETLESVREHELKKLVRPAVLAAKGDSVINAKVLNNAIEKGLAGQKEHIEFAVPKELIEKIKAGNVLQSSIPGMKSSGTAGWQQKMMAFMPQSAMAAVSMLVGHNPAIGWAIGHVAKLLGRETPDAIKLGLLRFMATDAPVKPGAFKAMVEFLHNSLKGEQMMARATGNLFKAGAKVLTEKEMPNQQDRDKLDKIIDKIDRRPDTLMHLTDGQTGHYLPDHQIQLTAAGTRAADYLRHLKPRPFKPGPLDKPIEPDKAAVERYERALDIAQQPAVIYQHIKDGTIQLTDLQDLKALYPAMYTTMCQKIGTQINSMEAQDETIPYKTRIGISLFLGQPMDSTMTPGAIQNIQMMNKPKPMPPGQPQGAASPKGKSTNSLSKLPDNYSTPNQKSEQRRGKE